MESLFDMAQTGLEELATKIDAEGTRRAYAEKLGISENYLSQLLNGDRPFSRVPVSLALKISQTAEISIERLAGAKQIAAMPTARRAAGQR